MKVRRRAMYKALRLYYFLADIVGYPPCILAVALAWLCQCLGNLLMRIHMLGLIFRLTWRKKDKQKSR